MTQSTNRYYQYILFDLDDTVYPKESGLLSVMEGRILRYMVEVMGIPADDAPTLKQQYYQRYGTTVRGLMVEHNIDPAEFLRFVHDVNPADFFGASPPLDRMLHALPLRKAIFTNSEAAHSERVLNTLQVRTHFDPIIDICAINFNCKPHPLAYKRALEIINVPGESCIMLEDKPRNLLPAKDLGMTTILVGSEQPSLAVDYAVPTIFHAERVLKQLLPLQRY
jgi:putative hydrolase of the HAD superfamily